MACSRANGFYNPAYTCRIKEKRVFIINMQIRSGLPDTIHEILGIIKKDANKKYKSTLTSLAAVWRKSSCDMCGVDNAKAPVLTLQRDKRIKRSDPPAPLQSDFDTSAVSGSTPHRCASNRTRSGAGSPCQTSDRSCTALDTTCSGPPALNGAADST